MAYKCCNFLFVSYFPEIGYHNALSAYTIFILRTFRGNVTWERFWKRIHSKFTVISYRVSLLICLKKIIYCICLKRNLTRTLLFQLVWTINISVWVYLSAITYVKIKLVSSALLLLLKCMLSNYHILINILLSINIAHLHYIYIYRRTCSSFRALCPESHTSTLR